MNMRKYKKKVFSTVKLAGKLAVSSLLYYSGSIRLYRRFHKEAAGGIRILAYHDIGERSFFHLQVPERIFLSHVKYLVENNYNVISLEEAADLLKSKSRIPGGAVVITFDDGYKSIHRNVLPIVKRYGIPATVFLSAGPVETGKPLFVDALAHALEKTESRTLDLRACNLMEYDISTRDLKEAAGREINEYGKGLKTDERMKLLEFIFERLGVSPADPEHAERMLTWGEVVELRNAGISFGAHTLTHPSLARIPEDEARVEMIGSKKMLEERLGSEVKTFAYPYGSANDVNERVKRAAGESGFLCACSLEDGVNGPGDDLLSLKRTCVINQLPSPLRFLSKAFFATEMSGIFSPYRNKAAYRQDRNKVVKKTNILFIIDELMNEGGTEKHLYTLAAGIDREKFNVSVCYFHGDESGDGFVQYGRKLGIDLSGLPVERIYSANALFQAFRLAKIIRERKIDIVQTFHFKSDTYGVLISKLAGTAKVISSRRDMGDLKKPRQIFLNKIMNRWIDRYIMVCAAVGKRFHETEGIPEDRMITLYNGVDLERFNSCNRPVRSREELGIGDGDFVVGTAAHFRPEKAYDIFFEGINAVRDSIENLKVIVLGDGPTKKQIEAYCREKGLESIVKFMGHVKDTENYVPLMDVFCLVPNKNEGFSNSILEAMAMGRPVIATDVGGNAESVVNNETGLVIPPDDAEAFAKAVLRLYSDAELRIGMGDRARKRVEEVFPLELMIRKHEDLYEDALREGREKQSVGALSCAEAQK